MNNAKTINSKTLAPLMVAAAFGMSALTAQAATITFDSRTKVTSNTAWEVSVFDGKAGYDGLASGTFGDGTVAAYRFWQNVGGGSGVNGVATYAQGGGLISEITQTKSNPPTYGVGADVWTTSDPGVGYSTTPDYQDGVSPIVSTTVSGAYNVDGTIDISGLVSGTAYILAGAYQNSVTVALDMTGSGQTTQSASNNYNTTNDRNVHVFAFSFGDAAGYDQISYSFDNTGNNASNRSRFMGVVVDGEPIPEPASLALLGFGGLLIAGRRTR